MSRAAARLQALIAGLWAGMLAAIGAMAAPSAFAVLAAPDAGRMAGRLFAHEAYLSLGAAVVLLILERMQVRETAPGRSTFSVNLALMLGAVFCTVGGYFGTQPMMAAARAGQGSVSFAALHLVSGGLFVLKGLLVLALAWRSTVLARPERRV